MARFNVINFEIRKGVVDLFPKNILQPLDTCGCGDVGYLTLRTLPIDLAQGVGKIHRVPIYHCKDEFCTEYTIPSAVAIRLEELAEGMEASGVRELDFTWNQGNSSSSGQTPADHSTLLQAFTLQFGGQKYEDARVVLVVPGECVFFQSRIDPSEYYLLRYEPQEKAKEIWFSFSKFYWEHPVLEYEDFLAWSEDGYLKELGRITKDEIEDLLEDEFGSTI